MTHLFAKFIRQPLKNLQFYEVLAPPKLPTSQQPVSHNSLIAMHA